MRFSMRFSMCSTMTTKRLNHCMILGVYPELVDDLDSTEIVEEFAKRNANRQHVFGKANT